MSKPHFLDRGANSWAVWLCGDCGTVSIRNGLLQIEIDYADALEVFPALCLQLMAMHEAGGPPHKRISAEIPHPEPGEEDEEARIWHRN